MGQEKPKGALATQNADARSEICSEKARGGCWTAVPKSCRQHGRFGLKTWEGAIQAMSLVLPTKSGKFGREITGDYNEINLLETDDAKIAKLEMWIAKNVGDTLVRCYPNREWGVRVDLAGQMLIITCDSVSVEKGYFISLVGRNIHDLQERAKLAAGEILERHGLSRSRGFDETIFETLPRDLHDNVITEDSKADDI